MSFDKTSVVQEVTGYSANITSYLAAESTYASDSTQPVPEFKDFFTTFNYQELKSASLVNSLMQGTVAIGSMMDSTYRVYATQREYNHVLMTKADYYNKAASQWDKDNEYEVLRTIEATQEISGTTPYQGGG